MNEQNSLSKMETSLEFLVVNQLLGFVWYWVGIWDSWLGLSLWERIAVVYQQVKHKHKLNNNIEDENKIKWTYDSGCLLQHNKKITPFLKTSLCLLELSFPNVLSI